MIMRYRIKLREEFWEAIKKEAVLNDVKMYEIFETICKNNFEPLKDISLTNIKAYKSSKYIYLTNDFKEKFALFAIEKKINSMSLAEHILSNYYGKIEENNGKE